MTQWVFTRGVDDQTRAFLSGFSEVVPLQWLQYFDERELEVSTFSSFDENISDLYIFLSRLLFLLSD